MVNELEQAGFSEGNIQGKVSASARPDPAIKSVETISPSLPFSHSQIEQTLRVGLLLVSGGLVAWFGWQLFQGHRSLICLLQSLALMGMLTYLGGSSFVRVILLVIMILNIGAILVNADHGVGTQSTEPVIAVKILASCLVLAFGCELLAFVRVDPRERILQLLFWSIFALPALVYVLVIPVMTPWFDRPAVPAVAKDPSWGLINECSFRAAKLAVFSLFAFLGACLGSFLNVVAYCLPRGEKVGLRDSACPQCKTALARIDNLPIFSYLNLGGRCRSCAQTIPVRYLAVELVAGVIFGSLFLYQLVTGCVNIPEFKVYSFTGVLWMILYPKWPAIGIYLFHVLFMCALLTLALIESDRLNLKMRHGVALIVAFAGVAIVFPVLHPVALDALLPGALSLDSKFAQTAISIAVGGGSAAVLGQSLGAVEGPKPLLGFILTGVVLGWQGMLQVAIVFVGVCLFSQLFSRLRELVRGRPTSVLLGTVMLHHPFWSMLYELCERFERFEWASL